LAGENSAFRTLLNNMPVTDLTRLVQLVEFFQVELDATQLATALDEGTLAKLMAAPPAADAILASTGSPATTLAWLELAGAQLPRVIELRLYETIGPLQMTTLSLASLLAIEDNAIIHKLAVLSIDLLLALLQLPTVDLKQVAAMATVDELSWFAGYVATLPSQEAAEVAHELARGNLTIATLQAPPLVTAPSVEGAGGVSAGAVLGDDQPSAEAPPAVRIVPEAVIALWQPYVNNGVAVAAGVVVLLLVAVGLALALRREMTDPPV
jgi:hypothetical protein